MYFSSSLPTSKSRWSKSDGVTTEHELGGKVVFKLTEQFNHRNHRVFSDNFFTSPTLFDELLSRGLYACGFAVIDKRVVNITWRV